MSVAIPALSCARLVVIAAAAVSLWVPAANSARGDDRSAAMIYQNLCASCHGDDGQGVEGAYAQPLAGDKSVTALAEVIDGTMPEDDPALCVGEDAQKVAQYIFDEFYSLEARERKGLIETPRVELQRLTVSQYQNAVADLVGHFTDPPRDRGRRNRQGDEDKGDAAKAPQPGLRAEYFQSKGMNKADELQQQRVDRYINFDFRDASPAENITADQFAVIWEGALETGETGHYEFRIRSENGVRLYVNSGATGQRGKLRDDSSVAGEAALIDGWVSSGEMRELSERIFLLGGRQYPFRLEFFKYLQETASVRLEWKPPGGTWAVLGHNHLSTARPERVFVVETPFPPDDHSAGYERGVSVSPAWHTATTNAAIETANEVIDRLPSLADLDDDEGGDDEAADDEGADDAQRLEDFAVEFASIAFRRPLSEAEERLYREVLFAESADPKAAVRRAVLLTLTSPHFLYTDLTPVDQPASPYTVASRLAFALWDSLPDKELLAAARDGQLATNEQIGAQAERMVNHPRTRAKMRGFFEHWLELEDRDLAKDNELFPEFDEATRADLRYSLELFIDRVLWSDESDYRELLLADYLLLNDRLRRIYPGQSKTETADAETADAETADAETPGALDPPDSEFSQVAFDAEHRAGLLTHPYLLSAYAYHNNTSPIHRGVFLARSIVGRPLRPPPVAVSFKDEEFDPDLTMREKITQLTSDNACMSCHSVINPLGFALETYDAVGRWRTEDNNKPINSASQYATPDGEILEFESARDVAEYAATSESAQRAFITEVFQHLVKQSPLAFGDEVVDDLHSRFVDDHYNIQKLLARIAVVSATHQRTSPPLAKEES